MDEFSLIAKYFAPLAADFPGALGLKDDAAVLTPPAGQELVLTMDTITEGVHFIGDEPPGLIARKLMRVNLSDLAAMGAAPWAYLLACAFPETTDELWLALFAQGLQEDQERFGIALAGGDTTATPGPLTLCLTAVGQVPRGQALRRSGAKSGDKIYVSGTLGDAALGLKLLREEMREEIMPEAHHHLIDRYHLPRPRLALGQRLRGIATACMDVSDGLAQDLGHLCRASGVGARMEIEKIPLSPGAKALLEGHPELWQDILSGGDDYELLFTAPPERHDQVMALANDPAISCIGEITLGEKAVFLLHGKACPLEKTGFRHFG